MISVPCGHERRAPGVARKTKSRPKGCMSGGASFSVWARRERSAGRARPWPSRARRRPRTTLRADCPLSSAAPSPPKRSRRRSTTSPRYNNYYEFGTDKSDPAANAGAFHTRPWTVAVRRRNQQARGRRHRRTRQAVPARGAHLPDALRRGVVDGHPVGRISARPSSSSALEPTSNAKYVAFTTKLDPSQMPGQKRNVLDWPYVEGLRIDEAMNPLALLAVGLYGRALPNQNGAPLRLVVPWKYGFKGIKAICQDRVRQRAAEDDVEQDGARRIRLLRQRQSRGRPSALEPGQGAPHRRVLQAQDAALQRLRRSGGEPLHGHGPAKVF